MKNKIKALLFIFLVLPSLVLFSACGGNPNENGGDGGGDTTTPPTYSLSVEVDSTQINYIEDTNTILYEYGEEFYIHSELFNVKLIGSDGSSQTIFYSYEENKEFGYIFSPAEGFELYNPIREAGDYTLTIEYKTYSAVINIKITEAIIEVPTLLQNSFEYGNYIFIQQYISNFDYNTMQLDYDSDVQKSDVGNYNAVVKLRSTESSAWSDGTTEDKHLSWFITPQEIEGPTVTETTFNYEPSPYPSGDTTGVMRYINVRFQGGNASMFEESDEYDYYMQSEAGNYTTRYELSDNYKQNYVIAGTGGKTYVDIHWTITPITLTAPTLKHETLPFAHTFDEDLDRYKGVSQTNEIIYASGTEDYIEVDATSDSLTNTLSRSYKVKFNTINSNYVFTGGESSLTIWWAITRMKVNLPTLLTETMEYKHEWTGEEYVGVEQTVEFDYHGLEELFYLYSGSLTATNAGSYDVALTLRDYYNYEIIGSANYGDTYTYTITPMVLESPYISDSDKYLEYKFTSIEQEYGNPIIKSTLQKPTISGLPTLMHYLININNAGAYEPNEEVPYYATISLRDQYEENYVWSTTGSNEPLNLEYYITKIAIDITSMQPMKILRAVGYVDNPGFIGSDIYYAGFYEDEKFAELYYADTRLKLDYKIDGTDFPYAGKIGSYSTLAFIEYPTSHYKIVKTIDGEVVTIDSDGRYEEVIEWEITKHILDYKNLSWNYGDLLYTGEVVQTPFLDGEIISSVGLDNIKKLNALEDFLVELGFDYSIHKYDEEKGSYFPFEGDIVEKGKYSIFAQPIFTFKAYTYDEDNLKTFTINPLQDERFIVLNCPELITTFEIGKEPIYMTYLEWENEEGFEYNNCPLTPALPNVSEFVTYEYTYYDSKGQKLDYVPMNAGRYEVEVKFIYDSEKYQLLNLFIGERVAYEIRKVVLDAGDLNLVQDTFIYSGEEIQPKFDESCLPDGVAFEQLSGIINMDEAGTYEVFVHLKVIDEVNYALSSELIRLEWKILKQEIDCTGFDIVGEESYEYDGTQKDFAVQNVPEKVNVFGIRYYKWEQNDWIETHEIINAGRYKAELDYFIDIINYEPQNLTITSKEFEITPYIIVLDELEWTYEAGDEAFVYDGNVTVVTLKEEPQFVETYYIYRNASGQDIDVSEVVNSGTYYVEAFFNYPMEGNIEVVGDHLILEFEVEKKSIDMSGVAWPTEWELEYTGEAQKYELEYESLPEEIKSITYTYKESVYGNLVDELKNADIYTVCAHLDYDTTNYKLINAPSLETGVRINPASLFHYVFEWDYNRDNPYVYDGEEHLPQITNLPEGVYAYYKLQPQTEPGSYRLEVSLSGENYYPESEFIYFEIIKATFDPTCIQFSPSTFIYDGTEKTPELVGLNDELFTIEKYYPHESLTNINVGTYGIQYRVRVIDNDHYNSYSEIITVSYTILPYEVSMAGARWEGEHVVDFMPDELLQSPRVYPHLTGTQEEINFVYRYYKQNEETKEYERVDYLNIAGKYRIEFYPEDSTNYILTDVEDVGTFDYTVNKVDFDWSLIDIGDSSKDAYGNYIVTMYEYDLDDTKSYGPYLMYTAVRYGYLGMDKRRSVLPFNEDGVVGVLLYGSHVVLTILEGEFYVYEDGVYYVKVQVEIGDPTDETSSYNYSKKIFDINYRVLSEADGFGVIELADKKVGGIDMFCMEYLDVSALEIQASDYFSYAKLRLRLYNPSLSVRVIIGANSSTYIPDSNGYVNAQIPFGYGNELTIRVSGKYFDTQEVTIKLIGVPELIVNGETIKDTFTQTINATPSESGKLEIGFNTNDEVFDEYIGKTNKEYFEQYYVYYSDSEWGERTQVTLDNPTIVVEGYDDQPFSGECYLFFVHKSINTSNLDRDYYTFMRKIVVE